MFKMLQTPRQSDIEARDFSQAPRGEEARRALDGCAQDFGRFESEVEAANQIP